MWASKLTKSDDTQRSTLSTITKLPLFEYFQSNNSYSVLAGTLRLVLHGTLKGLYKIDFSIKAYVVSYFVYNKLEVNGFMGNKYTISYTQSFRGTKKRDASVGTEITQWNDYLKLCFQIINKLLLTCKTYNLLNIKNIKCPEKIFSVMILKTHYYAKYLDTSHKLSTFRTNLETIQLNCNEYFR